ncbi:glycosyltransferase family 2 protein [Hymenobacter cavernae]|uniref:Glycosyl transferase n=1 Tax=Hymenobacter cavernae TaxID=2044852 RepID=A0ABQ1UCN4_9BACT|nr:glycosyltransferase [Hymenobacter cavernae]GGF13798.1 glycosyl transferase [Hymenobacter cavernae]
MPGLSILIPVYNRDVRELVQTLQAQVAEWPGAVEIICLDDGSEQAFRTLNQTLASLPEVQYEELPRNIGRAAIRNRLAARAQHPWLLLLDNNVRLPQEGFLARYAAALDQAPVLVGGTAYERYAPTQLPYVLRWKYGSSREARPLASRQQAAYEHFNLKNVLLRADVLRQTPLDERLTGYGHEDTRFGWDLRTAGIPVLHLDNPVLHSFLESAEAFLNKTSEGVRNLAWLYHQDGLGAETRLLRTALLLRRWRLSKAARKLLEAREPRMRRNLLSPMPNLRQLDLLKLYWLLTELARLNGRG